MNEFLRADGLYKAYSTGGQIIEVLCGLDLVLMQGDIVAIVGESGSGKSTLLHLLGGMDHPDKGTVHIEGKNIYSLSSMERAKFRNTRVGFVFQFHHLLPEFSALENIMIPPLIQGKERHQATDDARKILEEVGLGKRAHHRPAELSGGEQQRVALARALVACPLLLLADEPTGNLDGRTAAAMEELLLEIHARRGLSIILVTHSERLARCGHRMLRLENGTLLL